MPEHTGTYPDLLHHNHCLPACHDCTHVIVVQPIWPDSKDCRQRPAATAVHCRRCPGFSFSPCIRCFSSFFFCSTTSRNLTGQLPWRAISRGLLTHAVHCSMLLVHHEQLLLLLIVHVHSCCLLLLLHEGSLVHIWRSHTCWGQMRKGHVSWMHNHWSSKGWLHGGCLWVIAHLTTHARSHVAVHGCMRGWATEGGRRGLAPNTRRGA